MSREEHWGLGRKKDARVPHPAGFLGQTPTLGIARSARGTGGTRAGLLVRTSLYRTRPDVSSALHMAHRACVPRGQRDVCGRSLGGHSSSGRLCGEGPLPAQTNLPGRLSPSSLLDSMGSLSHLYLRGRLRD